MSTITLPRRHARKTKAIVRAAICLTCSFAAGAATSALVVPTLTANPPTSTREQTLMESTGLPRSEWPDLIEDEQGTWALSEVHEPQPDPSWQRPSQTTSITRTASIDAADIGTAKNAFEETVEYDEEGWAGTLERIGITSEPCYEVLSRQVDRLVTLTGFPSNDVAQLPQTMDFEVATADTLTSTAMMPLSLSDVAWTVSATDDLGIPTEYAATCNYRGTEEYLTIPRYAVTCTWSGEIRQKDTQMLSTATYVLQEPYPWWAPALAAGATGGVALLGTSEPGSALRAFRPRKVA